MCKRLTNRIRAYVAYGIVVLVLLVIGGCRDSNSEKISNKENALVTENTTINEEKSVLLKKQEIDLTNTKLNWKKTGNGLWQSENGDLGIKTIATLGRKHSVIVDVYMTTCCGGKSLESIIDTRTFESLDNSFFYKDKNHVYVHYTMAHNDKFFIVKDADVETFKLLGDCYAQDKNHIFSEKAVKMDFVDSTTFKTIKGLGCYAKDKNGYYFHDTKIDLDKENIIDNETAEKLKRL